MNPYIITLIGIGILAPVIYFVPSGLTRNGKWILLLASFIIAETGVLAFDIFPYLQAAGLLLLLIILSSYLLHNRVGGIFMNSAALESAAANQKSEEAEQDESEERPLSDSGPVKSKLDLVNGTSQADQPGLPQIQSINEEAEPEPIESVMMPGEGFELEVISTEGVKEPNVIPADSGEFEDPDSIPVDNSEYIFDVTVDTEIEFVEESEDYPTLEKAADSMLLSDLLDEEADASSEGIEEQEEEESYLASIEKMLEEGDLDDIDTYVSLSDSLTNVNRSEATDELESFTDVLEEEEEDFNPEPDLYPTPEEPLSVLEAQSDLDEIEELSAVEEEPNYGASEEVELSSTADNLLSSSSQQELNTLIIDSLKFAKFEMGSDNYINLLENQLEKELPVQMHYEIALMLMNAYFKAGHYKKSMNLLEEMKTDFGHLPVVSLELETLFANVKKFIKYADIQQ